MFILILLFSQVLSAPTSEFDADPLNKFALRLLDNVFAFQENFEAKNIAISPISIWSVFSLLAEGASGDTFNELMKELKLPNDLRATQSLQFAVKNLIQNQNQDVTLKGQKAMFTDCALQIHPEFCKSANALDTEVYSVDASNTTKLASDINYYICLATEGRIRNIVKPDVLEGLRLIILDALYFKANWTHPFDPTQTKQEAFYNYQGKTVGAVNMMYHKAPHNLGDSVQIGAQILEMTYGKNAEFSMLILLPFDGVPVKKLLNNLATEKLDWMKDYKINGHIPDIDVYVPRFRITSQTDLIPSMQYMGIYSIFDVDKAQLPGISDSPLFVSKSLQNVDVEVTEEGTIAAAVTSIGLEDRILGQRFEANKEFVFLIIHRQTNAILFSGVYSEPSLQ